MSETNGTTRARKSATKQRSSHHVWCDDHEHDLATERCSSHVVDFTTTKHADDSVPEAGWWGWLTAAADDILVDLVIEGRPLSTGEAGEIVCFEIPVWHMSGLRDVLDDERGRASLNGLLKRLPR